jgi:prepilin-type N-terminal cleavage/methylation domain-containing protein
MKSRRAGFTMIELLIAIMVGLVLTSIAYRGFSGYMGRTAARSARNSFAALHARTRATAIEMGTTVQLNVDRDADSVWIQRGTTRVETVVFGGELGVDIQGSGTVRLCMNPRGFAETACNSFSGSETLVFAAGTDTAGVQLREMGQLYY